MQLHLLFGPVAAVAGAATVLAWRMRETQAAGLASGAFLVPPLA